MTRNEKIRKSFLWALIGPLMVVSFAVLLNRNLFSIHKAEVWTIIFALGVVSSLWLQLTVSLYFHFEELYESTNFPAPWDILEKFVLPILMIGSAVVAVTTVMKYEPIIHQCAAIAYLFLVALWDWAEWKVAKPSTDPIKAKKALRLQDCCRQLFRHIDAPTLGVIVFWVILVAFWGRGRDDGGNFNFVSQLDTAAQQQSATIPNVVDHLKNNAHKLGDALLAGVMGFHMLVTVALLFVHLDEWEDAHPAVPAKPVAPAAPSGP